MTKKCNRCKGEGEVMIQHPSLEPSMEICPECQGLGVPLRTILEEQFKEACSMDESIIYNGDNRYIDFEEEDYEY